MVEKQEHSLPLPEFPPQNLLLRFKIPIVSCKNEARETIVETLMYHSNQFPARADGSWIINKVIRTVIFKKTVKSVNSGEIPFIKIKNTEWKKEKSDSTGCHRQYGLF